MRWCAVTGPGVLDKSKLLKYYIETMNNRVIFIFSCRNYFFIIMLKKEILLIFMIFQSFYPHVHNFFHRSMPLQMRMGRLIHFMYPVTYFYNICAAHLAYYRIKKFFGISHIDFV